MWDFNPTKLEGFLADHWAMAVQFEGVRGFWLIGAIRTTCRDPDSAETHSYTSTPAWPVILDLF